MANKSRRVLIVEHDVETGALLKNILDQEGYVAESVTRPKDIVAEVRAHYPDLVIYEMVREQPDPYRNLDLLRNDPETNRIPVLVSSTAYPEAEAALASYNVRGVLFQPFDLHVFLDAVRLALGQPSLSTQIPREITTHRLIFALGYHIIAEHSRETLFSWIQRLQAQHPWRGRTDLHLASLIDHVPLYVEALCCELSCGGVLRLFESIPDLAARLCQHAHLRRSQGIALEFVVREVTILRQEVWVTLQRYLPRQLSTDDLLDLESLVNRTLDQFLEIEVGAYSEAMRAGVGAVSEEKTPAAA